MGSGTCFLYTQLILEQAKTAIMLLELDKKRGKDYSEGLEEQMQQLYVTPLLQCIFVTSCAGTRRMPSRNSRCNACSRFETES